MANNESGGIISFFVKWIQVSVLMVVSFLVLAFFLGTLPESTVDESGYAMVVGWLVFVYVVGHYGIWHREKYFHDND